jgi:hypothetical protein
LCWPSKGATLRGDVSQSEKAEGQVGQPDLAEQWMILLDDHAARRDLRIGDDFVDPLHGRRRHLRGIERRAAGLDGGLRHRPRADLRENLLAMGIATHRLVQTGVGRVASPPISRAKRFQASSTCAAITR